MRAQIRAELNVLPGADKPLLQLLAFENFGKYISPAKRLLLGGGVLLGRIH